MNFRNVANLRVFINWIMNRNFFNTLPVKVYFKTFNKQTKAGVTCHRLTSYSGRVKPDWSTLEVALKVSDGSL